MTSLRLHCETCQTKLKVRDPGFIGQVHACPRCGSMVLISGPDPEEAIEGEPASDDQESSPASRPALVLGLSDTLVSAEEEDSASVDDIDQIAPEETTESLSEAIEATAEPQDTSQAEAIGSVTNWPLITTSMALVGAGVIGVTWFLSAPLAEPTDPKSVAAVIDPVALEDEASEAESLDKPIERERSALIEPDKIEPDYLITVPNQTLAQQVSDPVSSVELTNLPPEPPATLDERPSTSDVAEPSVKKLSTWPQPEEASEPTPLDPIDFDPDTIDLVLRGPGSSASVPTEEVPSDQSQPLVQAPFDPRTENPRAEDSLVLRLDQRLGEVARHGGVDVRRGPTGDPTTAPPTESAERFLNETLPSIDLESVPLVEAADLFGALIGSPVTLEPTALAMAGLEADSPINIRGENNTLGDLLKTTLQSVRLGYKTEGAHLVVWRPDAARQALVEHQLIDLVANDPEGFNRLLRTVGPDEIADSPVLASEGLLSLEASRQTHYELLLLCERLRMSRGLPLKSRYPKRLLSTKSAAQALAPTLKRRTTFSFVQPTALQEVLAHWRRTTGLSLLADWQSLGEVGLGPRTTIECTATNRPWSAALSGVLEPLGLGWVAINDQTLWITTQERLEVAPFVEFYPLATAESEAIREDLLKKHPHARVAHDPAGQVLIVRGPAQVQQSTLDLINGKSNRLSN